MNAEERLRDRLKRGGPFDPQEDYYRSYLFWCIRMAEREAKKRIIAALKAKPQ